MADAALAPGSTIGILGGGQLGRMLACAAAEIGLKCRIFCDGPDAPAFDVAATHVCAPYDDIEAVQAFARGCDVVTFEFENVPLVAVEAVTALAPVYPPPRALEATQDRLVERRFLDALSIPVAPYREVGGEADLARALEEIGQPAMLKSRRLGYDGKGQIRIEDATDSEAAYREIGTPPAILEAFVAFESEVSVVAVRNRAGQIAYYDLAENQHDNQILKQTRVPARTPDKITAEACGIAERIAGELDYTGVFCVEFFYCGETAETPLLVNEIAPRVHNSGHWTLDGCPVSQFENHIRAVAGWPLGTTGRHADAVMTNLVGADVDDWHDLAAEPGASLHLYGKREVRLGRKMGHVTRILPKSE